MLLVAVVMSMSCMGLRKLVAIHHACDTLIKMCVFCVGV